MCLSKAIPPYGRRKGFVPRTVEDFGDGGAFPEIHVAQYPLDMGRPGRSTSRAVVQVTGEGDVDYDAILHQGHDKDRVIHSKYTDLVEVHKKDVRTLQLLRSTGFLAVCGAESVGAVQVVLGVTLVWCDQEELERPGLQEEIETANRTRAALEALVNRKISMARPVVVPDNAAGNTKPAKYIRYTPSGGVTGATNSGAKQRIVRLVEAPVDPLEPPKFKHTKVPRGPPSPPVPVMHSPKRKVTAADQKAWTIPPCVSNWKNAKGYTIPLDKRLAADGRSLQEASINDKFAKVAEALQIAQQQAREGVALRAKVQKRIGLKQKEQVEDMLRQEAAAARAQRAGILMGKEGRDSGSDSDTSSGSDSDSESDGAAARRGRSARASSMAKKKKKKTKDSGSDSDTSSGSDSDSDAGSRSRSPVRREDPAAAEARRLRDRLRRERRKEREREMRLEKLGKKTKTMRDAERDISEKIALGMHTAGKGGGDMFDARLFNQSQGLDSGFGEEDSYNVYSKPLFAEKKHSVYRPKKGDANMYGANAEEEYNRLRDTSRFKPGKDFEGVDRTQPQQPRGEPVQFEKSMLDDTFDVDGIASAASQKKPLEKVGGVR